jgi:hypothetical protein
MSTALNTYSDSLGCPARLNPLAVARTDSLAFQFERGCWESALEKLSQLQFRAAIVGPKGSGKTTLLEQLQLRLLAMGYHCALRRAPSARVEQAILLANAKELPSNSLLLLDSAEQLSRSNRRALLRESECRNLGLVVTTHRAEFLPTWIECRTSPELMHSLLEQLLPADRSKWEPLANEAFRKHQGNIREVFRELYDRYASGELV